MKADGSIIIDTRINTAGFGKGATNLKSQFGSLGSSVKKLGGLIAAAFSVKAIVAFSKEAIEMGSNLQEVQNVVDVTFTAMNERVNEFAKNADKTAGLSETMAKRYVGTFGAMAKSFQFTEEEAYNMSTALTQLAGDAASFYNISQDEAYTKLKSVFTGETESLKDLGVVMTQTALDDFALRKGLSKTTSEMTEQEKVALRYQFVMEQLAGASGDFLRTSDSWANQTRLLSLQFDQLKATVGQGLINALTPAIKAVNTLLEQFQKLADRFLDFTIAAFGNAGSASTGISDAAESAGELADNIEAAGKTAKKYLAPFDEIAKLGSTDNTSAIPSSSTELGNGTVTVGSHVEDNLSPQLESIAAKVKSLISPLEDIDFSNLKTSLSGLGDEFLELVRIIADDLEWAWSDVLVPLFEWNMENYTPVYVDTLTSSLDFLKTGIEVVGDSFQGFLEQLDPVFEWIGDTAVFAVQKLGEQFEDWSEWLEEKGPQIADICKDVGESLRNIWTIAEPALTGLRDLWGKVWDKITDKTQRKIWEILNGIRIITDFLTSDLLKGTYNTVVGYINAIIDVVVGGINSIIEAANGLSFDVPEWVPVIGGETFGFDIQPIKAPQIPYLAQGAVIPPNAPFMAVLGDQKHGTNIEAPLETIQEAVAIVMEDMIKSNIAGHEATVAVLKEILEAILGISIGDDVIGQAVARYNARMAIIKGGNA